MEILMYLEPCLRTDATDMPVMRATSCSFRSVSSCEGIAFMTQFSCNRVK